MMKIKLLIIWVSALLLSGCSVFGTWYGETKPMMTFAELTAGGEGGKVKSSKIFVWSPKNSAAFVNFEGHGCVQGAEVFHEKSGKVDVGAELLAVLSGIDLSKGSEGEKALALEITNEIVALRTNSERNTYLSIGMFGLCQLQANGGLTKIELLELMGKLLDNSLKIGEGQAPMVSEEETPVVSEDETLVATEVEAPVT
jgi:hypothetical protein